MIMSEAEARRIANSVLSKARGDSASVAITSAEERNIRFARNNATTNGSRNIMRVSVTVNVGRRSGEYTTSRIDEAGLADAVSQATAIARLAPENTEFTPPLGPQTYLPGAGWHAPSARADARRFADVLAPAVRAARDADVTAAGYLEGGPSASAYATSAGLFVYDRRTDFDLTMTARLNDGAGSGWAAAAGSDITRFDGAALGRIAIDKAVLSRAPQRLEPGRYTVVLEPSPAADLLGTLGAAMDARAADEGRSAFSKRGGGNRIGERVLGENVTIRSDPGDALAPCPVYGEDGLPHPRITWFQNGVLRALPTTRFWAARNGAAPIPRPANFIVEGGAKSTHELVRSVERGVLVTRFWYIRFVDQRTMVLTGLTRDGMFWIENGEIVRPVSNMRWNESPLAVLNNVVEFGATMRARGTEQSRAIACPPILARDFTFSSVSEAV
jgi:predicted Zn-dependent protease